MVASPFGDGRAAERIVGAILGEPVEAFGEAARSRLTVVA
jgi:hypothetical protein